MASSASFVAFVLEQAAGAGALRARKMFGEYALYRGDKLVALICDNLLFVKPTEAGRALLREPAEGAPYPGAKPHLQIDEDSLEDRDLLAALLIATDAALPPPKPRKPAQAKTLAKPKKPA
jgi:TfoX/Sxy family transcriptional regulator of competence genes